VSPAALIFKFVQLRGPLAGMCNRISVHSDRIYELAPSNHRITAGPRQACYIFAQVASKEVEVKKCGF